MRNEVKEYLGAVEKELLCEKKQKRALLKRLQTDVEAFCEECADGCDKDLLTQQFGTPQEVAAAVLRTENVSTIRQRLSMKKIVIAVVVSTCVLIAIAFTCYLEHRAKIAEDIANGYYIETIYDGGVVEGTPPPWEETDRVYSGSENLKE